VNSTRRLVSVAAVALVLVCAAIAAIRLVLPGTALAPDFTLTDQDGRPYTLSAQRGHAIALFFGYAHCPDICPTTLAALARAKRQLGAAGSGFDVVFVTVDPGTRHAGRAQALRAAVRPVVRRPHRNHGATRSRVP
jgi:protein SCO1/2